jgi:hypothetical protein
MKVTQCSYEQYEKCLRIEDGELSLVVSISVGPRIIHFSSGRGRNILFNDTSGSLKNGDWRLYGGHRFWIGPETKETYCPDNAAVETHIETDSVSFTTIDAATSLKKTLKVSVKNNRVFVEHKLVNTGDVLYSGALWALTCVNPEGVIFIPWNSLSREWVTSRIVYWQKWMDHASDVTSSQYKNGKDFFTIHVSGEEGKVGSPCDEGFVGVTTKDYTFIKKFDRYPTAQYQDDGCAAEIYTCKQFVEIESLSPMHTFLPGNEYLHREEWILVNKPVDLSQSQDVRMMVR